MLRDLQRTFHHALLTGDPEGLKAVVDMGPIPLADRFHVHANTFIGFLIDALAAAYPVTAKALGTSLFRAAAAAFVRHAPPAVPQLSAYGDGFGPFLAQSLRIRPYPQIVDLADLEWARMACYFAADARPVTVADLQGIEPSRYPALGFVQNPAVRLLRSRHGAWSVWHHVAELPDEPGPQDVPRPGAAEAILIFRTAGTVRMDRLTDADMVLTEQLFVGARLGDAAAAAFATDPAFDLQQALFAHLNRGTFARVLPPSPGAMV